MSKFEDIPRRGTSHHGLATRDADGTIALYEGVLGFPLVFQNIENGTGRRRKGQRHLFFDLGHDEFFTLFEEDPWEGPGPDPLQVSSGLCYFSFRAGSDWTLEQRRQQLIAAGIPVSEIVRVGTRYADGSEADLAHRIYFRDPVNGFQCDFTYFVRDFNEKDLDVEMTYSADVTEILGTKQAVNA